MNRMGVVSKRRVLGFVLAAAGLLVISAGAQSRSYAAKPPQPDCGPTREWTCVNPRCQGCPPTLFEGTVCEKERFENRTGRVCS